MLLRLILTLTFFLIFIEGIPTTEYVHTIPLLRQGSKSYHLAINQRMNFLQAVRYCNNLNMSLITIDSKETNDIIYKYIRDADAGKEFWSSATRLVDGKSWIWLSNGHAVEYTNWDNGQPNSKTEHCIDLRIDSRNQLYWHDENCNAERPFICEKDETTDKKEDSKSLWSRISRSSINVYANIINIGKKTYYFSSQFKGTFWKSHQFCQAIGMKAASVENAEENDRIYRYLRDTNAATTWWTSGTRVLDDTTWFWLSNGRKIEYMNWHTVEPNNIYYVERCLQIVVDKNKGGAFFNDFTCAAELPVICEKDLEESERRYTREIPPWFKRAATVKVSKSLAFSLGKSYHLETEFQGDQQQATEFCNYLDMDLIDIISSDENKQIVVELEKNIEDGPFWTSGIKQNGEWLWQKTQAKILYKNWRIGRPGISQYNNCLLIDKMGRWIDRRCDEFHPFICKERSAPTEVPPVIDPIEPESEEECKQPVINIYINNNAAKQGQQSLLPVRIDDQSVGEEKSYLLKNKWASC